MDNIELIKQRIIDSIEVKKQLLEDADLINTMSEVAKQIIDGIQKGGKLVVCGNGGSASDALHFVSEIVGRFAKNRDSWPAIALNTNEATMTAIANDYGYDEVFARQAKGIVHAEDIFVGISTSGKSENVYRAMIAANKIGAKTVGLLGYDGGKIVDVSGYSIIVPSHVTARVQECHITIIHILCEIVEAKLSGFE